MYEIPLTYYGDRNLPFGIPTSIKANYTNPTGDKIVLDQKLNLTLNINSPFTVLFNLDGLKNMK